jgi:lipopolysaccharide export system protein LptC
MTMAMTLDPTAPDRDWRAQDDRTDPTARAARAEKAYRAARRHSRLVRFMRVAIPVGAILSFGAFIVYPFFDPFRAAGISVGAVKMDGTRVTMENPRLAGHRKDNKPYEVTAASAVQDIRVPNVVELTEMRARLVNSDDTVINLTAKSAVFDSQKEQLTLRDDVRVRTQSGQEATMRSADVDFKAGTVRSTDGVTVRLPDMSVSAEALDIVDSGAKVAFIGRVSALIDDRDSAEARAAARRPAEPQPQPALREPRSAPIINPVGGTPPARTTP